MQCRREMPNVTADPAASPAPPVGQWQVDAYDEIGMDVSLRKVKVVGVEPWRVRIAGCHLPIETVVQVRIKIG